MFQFQGRSLFLFVCAFIMAHACCSNVALAGTVELSDRVVVTTQSDNKSYEFKKNEAVDKGSFTSPAGFVQKNLCDTNPSLEHLTVCFRPDANGSRDEVVFEYGTFMKTPVMLASSTVAFYIGSKKLDEKFVARQGFYQRWRWLPQGYRPRYINAEQLENSYILLPYRKGVDPNQKNDTIAPPSQKCFYSKPFDTACVTQYMPMTGERDDIGHITGAQGNYLLSRSEDWWKVVLSQAEAGMGVPWNIRDEMGTPINFFRTENGVVNRLLLNAHSNNRGKPNHLDRVTNNNVGWHPDQAHQPALFYLPWLLTGDPYYLEGLQFANSSNSLASNWNRTEANRANIMSDQIRGRAWNLRTLITLRMTTPEVVPGWLLPRSYYERQSLENANVAVQEYVKSSDPLQSVLHTWSKGFWQQDFVTFETGWATLLGLKEWRPVFDFAIQNAISRIGGTSGWERKCPTVYYLPDDGDFSSWQKAWQSEMQTNNRVVPSDGLLCTPDSYNSYLLGVFAVATHLGVPNSETYYEWYHDMLKKTVKVRGYTSGPKWSVAPKHIIGSLPIPQPGNEIPTPPSPTTPTTPPTTQPDEVLRVTTTGDFTYESKCNSFAKLTGSCTIAVTFNPKTTGVHQGLLTIKNTKSGSSTSVYLAARALPKPELSTWPTPLSPETTQTSSPAEVVGTSGADTLSVSKGVKTVDGKSGFDVLKIDFSAPSNWWSVRKSDANTWTVKETHASGYTITLKNIEELVFRDGAKVTLDSIQSPITQTSADTITGTDGNDYIDVAKNIYNVDGKNGYDVANLLVPENASADWWSIKKIGENVWKATESHASGYTVILKNIEEVRLKGGVKKSLLGEVVSSSFKRVKTKTRFLSSSTLTAPYYIFTVNKERIDFGEVAVGKNITKDVTLTWSQK